MKKYCLVTLSLMFVAILFADIVVYENFNHLEINSINGYNTVEFENSVQFGNLGEPSLPWKGVKILLPQGEEAINVTVELSDGKLLNEKLNILPIQPAVRLSSITEPEILAPEGDIYYGYESYPNECYRNLTTQFKSGFSIAFLAVTPIQYNPHTGDTFIYGNAVITVETQSTSRAKNAEKYLNDSDNLVNSVTKIVNNPEMISSYSLNFTRDDEIDYLIIAEESKIELWQELATIHNGFGRITHIETIENIYSNNTGVDNQEKIRNYLKDKYEQNGIQYVLLAGDTEVIPHRGLWASVNNGDTVDDDIPADMYYSCLDRGSNINNGPDWNNDNDDLWGEEDECDLIPEFTIGRFPYNGDLEIQNFIHKVDSYMNYPVADQLETALLIGEDLGWEAWGGEFMNELIGYSATNGHITNGIPEAWDISTLYDMDATWNAGDLFPLLSNGNNLVNHLGHSSTTYAMKLVNSDVNPTNITNNGIDENYSIFFTQGCYAGAFDNRTSDFSYTSDCITEKFVSISTAAVSMISHSRYGWGSSQGTGGASQFYHREYLDAIFNDNIYDLGYALNQAKIEAIPFISGVMYWVDFETNIIGDPGLIVWTENATPLVATHAQELTIGSNQITVTTAYQGVVVSVLDGNTFLGSSITDASGSATVNFIEDVEDLTQLKIQASKQNYLPYHGVVTVIPANAPYVICQAVEYEETGEYIDGVIQSLDQLYLHISLENIGLQDTPEGLSVSLSTESQFINIINSEFATSEIASMESNYIEEAFLIELGTGISNNTTLPLTLSISSGSLAWQSDILLNVKAPELELAGYSASATTGEDSTLDPGESGIVSITLANNGEGYSYNLNTSLYTVDPFLIINGIEMVDFIEPGGIYTTGEIDIQITENCPSEYYGQIEVLVYDEIASGIITSFVIPIGIHGYNFENENVQFEHSAMSAGFSDQWHRDNYRNHTNDGEYSMKCGGEGASPYNNSLHSALYTPTFGVSGNSFIKFWHWMSAELDNGSQAWDGGNIMISINGGDFDLLTPVGNYPYTSVPNEDSPFEGGTPVFSGNIDWEEVELDLSGIIGEVVLAFVFGTDGYVAEEGWYIDDITLGSYTDSDDETVVPLFTELNQNYPNPFNPSNAGRGLTTKISYQLAESGKTELYIYNVKGQIVKTLVNDIQDFGVYNVTWDGQDDNGNTISSGVYFYQLKTAKYHSTKKMLMLK